MFDQKYVLTMFDTELDLEVTVAGAATPPASLKFIIPTELARLELHH